MTGSFKRVLGLLVALLLVTVACGVEEGGPTTAGPGTTAAPGDGTDTTAAPGGEAVEIVGAWTGTEQENFQNVLAAFTEQTGIQTSFSSAGDDVGAVLGTRIEGGNPPDVAMLPQPGLMRNLAERDALTELSDAASQAVDENYAPVWRELGTVDGTLYGVWFKAANKSTVWYNVPLWDENAVQPPEDWDGWQGTGDSFFNAGIDPIAVGGADGWTLTDWFENVYIRTAGPEMYDQLTAHEIPWTDDSVVQALETMGELIGNPDYVAGGLDGALQTNFPDSVRLVFSDPPEAATVYEGDFVAGVITGETDAGEGDFDFFAFPSIDGSPAAVVGGGDVAVVLTDNPSAMQLLEFLATSDAAEIWAGAGGFTSPNQNVDLGIYPDDVTRKSAEQLTQAETFRFDLSDLQPAAFGSTVGQGLFLRFQEWLENPDQIEQVTQNMEQDAEQAYGG